MANRNRGKFGIGILAATLAGTDLDGNSSLPPSIILGADHFAADATMAPEFFSEGIDGLPDPAPLPCDAEQEFAAFLAAQFAKDDAAATAKASSALADATIAALAAMGMDCGMPAAKVKVAAPILPRRKAGNSDPRGKAGSGKRASIKRAWLGMLADGCEPSFLSLAAEFSSTESSVRSICGDLRATMRELSVVAAKINSAGLPDWLAAAAQGGRENRPLALINRCAMSGESRSDCIAICAENYPGVRSDFVAGSLAAASESLAILAEFGVALNSDADRIAA